MKVILKQFQEAEKCVSDPSPLLIGPVLNNDCQNEDRCLKSQKFFRQKKLVPDFTIFIVSCTRYTNLSLFYPNLRRSRHSMELEIQDFEKITL